jgi:hypothetical protein
MLYSGTAYPVGNATHPVNNAGDLLGILSANNLNRISVRSRLSFGSSGLTGTTVTNSTSYYKNKLTADDDAAVFLNDKF